MALTYGSDEWEAAYQEILQRRLQEQAKPYITGTPEWIDAYEKLVQGDAEYREAAAGWEGTVVIHTLAEPSVGMDEDSYMLMDLWHGDCRKIRPVPKEVGESADYVITGSYHVWKQANNAEIDTNKAMMQGKLKLKGNLATIVRYVQASTRLTQLSSQMETRFPDEISPEELEELKQFGEEFKERLLS
jgi:putative sterol carrier protein